MIPLITCEITLCQYVCELVFGVNVFDLDLGVPNWFYQTTNQQQLCGNMSHCETPPFNDHFDHCFIVFEHIGLDFAVTRSSPESCWDRFAIISEQTVGLKWLILNKHNKWFHSSRVKFPLVRMSASWFLVSMYLSWIFRSKLIRSNNQFKATRWVLDTCLIVGLRPFIIIRRTSHQIKKTSRSTKHNQHYSSQESCWIGTLVWFWVCLFDGVLRNMFPCTLPLDFFSWFWGRTKHFP